MPPRPPSVSAPYLLRSLPYAAPHLHPRCTASVPRLHRVSATYATTTSRVSPKGAPHLSQGKHATATAAPQRCTAYLPISHRTDPKAAPYPRQAPPTYALGKPRAAVAAAPRAPRFARSREVVAWAAIGEREVGGFPWGGACVRCREGAAPDGRLLAAVGRCLRQLLVCHSGTKKPLPERCLSCRFRVFYRGHPLLWHSKTRLNHGAIRLETWFDRAETSIETWLNRA